MSSSTTIRETRFTWVRAVAQMTPKISCFEPVGVMLSTARKLSMLFSQESTWG
jgi:hypothetical protein